MSKVSSIALALILVVLRPALAEEAFHQFASLGTGEMTGVYYPVGSAICAIVTQGLRSTGVRCSPETTPGSVYNVDALRTGELEFAIVQSDVAYAAFNGKGAYAQRPASELRSVLALHPELVTIVARPGIEDLSDLAGKRVNVGPEGSGTRHTWEGIAAAVGWKNGEAPQIVDMPDDATGPAICAGSLDASLLVVGHPSMKVGALLARCPVNLVAVNGSAIDSLVAASPYFREGTIKGGPYGSTVDTPSFGVSAVLMTTANMDDRVVAAFARALVTQIETLKSKNPSLANLSLDDMVSGSLPAPIHSAAMQVYRELGLLN